MKKSHLYLLCSWIVACSMVLPIRADEKKAIYLTSLEWPPYVSEQLPDQGATALVARRAFAAMGYEVRISYFPWARTIMMTKETQKYIGYFPEYYSTAIEKEFIFSEPIGESPLGFAERTDQPISWKTLDDLKNILIGTVRGYVNTEEFDHKAANGELTVDPVTNDLINLRKVAIGRVALAVIDQHVMTYLLKTNAELSAYTNRLQFNARLLGQKKLYICFRRDPEGERIAAIFNEGVKKIDAAALIKEYFQKIMFEEK